MSLILKQKSSGNPRSTTMRRAISAGSLVRVGEAMDGYCHAVFAIEFFEKRPSS
jgi:hypothetical protein